MFTLGQAAQWLGLARPNHADRSVTGVVIDSRKIKPGMLFIACSGEHVDGHDFLIQAADAGACGALVLADRVTATLPEGFVLLKCDSVLDSFQLLARQYRDLMAFPIIAITGTNGKTTTKEMLVHVLRGQAKVVKTEGNLNNHLGVPLTLLNWPLDADFGVLEMGMNHPGEINDLCAIAQPTHGLITNVGEGHLEFLKSIEGVAQAKAELLDALSQKGVGFINGDDVHLKPYHQTADQTITYGFDPKLDVSGSIIRHTDMGCAVVEVENNPYELQIPGDHNASNALGVIAIARYFKYDWSIIKKGLESFDGYSGRLSVMHCGPVWIVDDTYNANPTSMQAAISALARMKHTSRHVAILGDMLELGADSETLHQKVGQIITEMGVDVFIGVGKDMKAAVEQTTGSDAIQTIYYTSLDACLAELQTWLQPGDAVLVKGSRGMKMENVVSQIKRLFENQVGEN